MRLLGVLLLFVLAGCDPIAISSLQVALQEPVVDAGSVQFAGEDSKVLRVLNVVRTQATQMGLVERGSAMFKHWKVGEESLSSDGRVRRKLLTCYGNLFEACVWKVAQNPHINFSEQVLELTVQDAGYRFRHTDLAREFLERCDQELHNLGLS